MKVTATFRFLFSLLAFIAVCAVISDAAKHLYNAVNKKEVVEVLIKTESSQEMNESFDNLDVSFATNFLEYSDFDSYVNRLKITNNLKSANQHVSPKLIILLHRLKIDCLM